MSTPAGIGTADMLRDAPAPVRPPPPEAPRALTPGVLRRSWAEPRVRFWWMLTVALLLVGGYVCGREWLAWSREARLVRSGRVVEAEIMTAAGLSSRWQQLPPDSVVTIHYEVDGKAYDPTGYLRGRKNFIQVRTKVPIRVDPSDPEQWTARTEPGSLAQQLTGAAVVLPAFVAMAAVSWFQRFRLLRVWRDGEAIEALVVDSRQTALAPRSRLVRCTPGDERDKRVVEVYVPVAPDAPVHPGDSLWLVFPPGGRGRPVAAAWFE